MSQAEERFMEARRYMEHAIADFYDACKAIELDNEGFAEDVNEGVEEATGGKVKFEDWME